MPNALVSFGPLAATNNSTAVADSTAPALLSAVVSDDGDYIILNFTETGSAPLLPATGVLGFSHVEGAAVYPVNPAIYPQCSANASGTTITLKLATRIYRNTVIGVTYSPGNVTDSTGNPLAAFVNYPVTNNRTERDGRGDMFLVF